MDGHTHLLCLGSIGTLFNAQVCNKISNRISFQGEYCSKYSIRNFVANNRVTLTDADVREPLDLLCNVKDKLLVFFFSYIPSISIDFEDKNEGGGLAGIKTS